MNESYSFYTDKLNGEYRDTFSRIELYVGTKYIDDVTKEEYLSDLLDIFLTAQSEGKPVQKITGSNLERFCKTFCSGYGLKNRVLDFLDSIKTLIWGIFAFTLIDMLFSILDYDNGIQVDVWRSNNNINIPVFLIGLLIAVLVGYVTNLIVRNIMFHTKHISMTVLQSICLLSIVAVMILTFIIMNNNDNLWNIPNWVVMLISIVYLVPYYIFNYNRLKEKKRNKAVFSDMLTCESNDALMEKRFQIANQKNTKKGKDKLTIEEFLAKEEKECRKTEKTMWFYFLIPIPITVIFFIGTWLFGGFETMADVLIFPLILLIIQYALMIVLWKNTKSGVEQYKSRIDMKREQLSSEDEDLHN